VDFLTQESIVRTRGFTLVELMVTLAIAGIILSFGLPAFATMGKTLRHRQAREELKQRLRGARQAAVTRHKPVIMSFGNGSQTSDITTYKILVDANGDGIHGSSESSSSYTLPRGCTLGSSGFPDTLYFDPSGAIAPGKSGGRLYVRGAKIPDTLEVAATGMVYRP
jgi:prepilin-type N-terminal cleavage/methylation domain-containing protein